MTDLKSQLKAHAKDTKKALPYLEVTHGLSHGHIIEILVALLSEAESWNHFAASPSDLEIPNTLTDYFNRIARGQRRMKGLQEVEDKPGDRGERALCMMDILSVVSSGNPDGFTRLNQLIDAEDYPDKQTPTIMGKDGVRVPASASFDPGMAIFNLGAWFFKTKCVYGKHYPWDDTKRLAIKKGFSESEAALIRQLQREAPNHSWPIELWFEVGVLDGDQEAFLDELKDGHEWELYFENLYENDGNYKQDQKIQ